MDDADRITSRRVLVQRLFMAGRLDYHTDMQYTDTELFAALAAVLVPIVGADALWAARSVLCPKEGAIEEVLR